MQLNATDPDANPLRFIFVNDSGGPFSLSTSGLLTVNTSLGWVNYEAKSTYTLTIGLQEVSNALGTALLYAREGNTTLVVNVRDVNEAPYFVNVPGAYRINEESTSPTVVTPFTNGTNIMVQDEDIGNNSALVVNVSSSATGYGSGYFEVVNASGSACRGGLPCVLRMMAGSPVIDYDAGIRSINVTVTVRDPLSAAAVTPLFNVTVDDINQGELG